MTTSFRLVFDDEEVTSVCRSGDEVMIEHGNLLLTMDIDTAARVGAGIITTVAGILRDKKAKLERKDDDAKIDAPHVSREPIPGGIDWRRECAANGEVSAGEEDRVDVRKVEAGPGRRPPFVPGL